MDDGLARFSGKVCHEPKDRRLTVHAKWKKTGVAVRVAYNKEAHSF